LSKLKRHKSQSQSRPSKESAAGLAPQQRGFDFGIDLPGVLLADMSFIDLLKQAEIIACSYQYVAEGPFGVPMREIALVGYHHEPLAKAFAEFQRWGASEDGDAVQLSFIFLKDGGYLLEIEREPIRATRNLRGLNRVFSPILIGGAYIKKFDTRHQALGALRKYKTKFLISPFLFGAASIASASSGILSPEDIQPIPSVAPLLKFEAEFVDEETLQPGARHHSLLKPPGARSQKKKALLNALPTPSKQKPADYSRHRKTMIERHFPVTVERIRAGRYSELMSAVRNRGVRQWQFEQAACNLLLSATLADGQKFYPNIPDGEFTKELGKALDEREERSDTPKLSQFSVDDIVTQVALDAAALLQAVGHVASSCTLEVLQEQLRARKLLEPPNA
jgi:hypothetical protein